MLMVVPAIEGVDLFKIAGRSISGWIPMKMEPEQVAMRKGAWSVLRERSSSSSFVLSICTIAHVEKGTKHMRHTFPLILPLLLLFSGILALSMGGGVASAASIPHPVNVQMQLPGKTANSVTYTGASLSKAAVVKANISRVSCNGSDYFRVSTDYDKNLDCFAYAGTMAVGLYNADVVNTGNNTGGLSFIWHGEAVTSHMGTRDRSYCIAPDCSYVYVYSITIN
jgi:hypothetical protein